MFWQSPAPSLEPRRRNGVGRRVALGSGERGAGSEQCQEWGCLRGWGWKGPRCVTAMAVAVADGLGCSWSTQLGFLVLPSNVPSIFFSILCKTSRFQPSGGDSSEREPAELGALLPMSLPAAPRSLFPHKSLHFSAPPTPFSSKATG